MKLSVKSYEPVDVVSERNKSPVAAVGDDKTLLLPVDTVVLDGSQSTDDDAIASYAWTQVAGPQSVTLENADRAVATVAGLTARGEYKFQLTVTDKAGLSGKATLTVTANESESLRILLHTMRPIIAHNACH